MTTTETVTTEVELPTVNSMAAFDDQQQALEAEYRDLVLRAASHEPFTSEEVHRLTVGTGRTLANFRQDVALGERRRAAAETLQQNDNRAAAEAEHQARATLDEAAAECRQELEALQRRHAERLQPLRAALEQARQRSREVSRVSQQNANVLLTTRSSAVDVAIESANRAATEHEKAVDGRATVLWKLRRKLKRIEAANISDAGHQREIGQLKQMIDRAQADLDEVCQSSPPLPPSDSVWLDWRAFDISSPADK